MRTPESSQKRWGEWRRIQPTEPVSYVKTNFHNYLCCAELYKAAASRNGTQALTVSYMQPAALTCMVTLKRARLHARVRTEKPRSERATSQGIDTAQQLGLSHYVPSWVGRDSVLRRHWAPRLKRDLRRQAHQVEVPVSGHTQTKRAQSHQVGSDSKQMADKSSPRNHSLIKTRRDSDRMRAGW
jgi:hypothetical protein